MRTRSVLRGHSEVIRTSIWAARILNTDEDRLSEPEFIALRDLASVIFSRMGSGCLEPGGRTQSATLNGSLRSKAPALPSVMTRLAVEGDGFRDLAFAERGIALDRAAVEIMSGAIGEAAVHLIVSGQSAL